MTISAEALRELHRIHRQLSDLRSRLERGPKQIKAGEANALRLEKLHLDAKETVTRARVAADAKQLQLKQREDRISGLRAKLNAASTNKEYQAIVEQIAADEQANSVLSDEILEALEKLDELLASVKEVEQNLVKVRQELERLRARVQEEQVGLESELARVSAELREAESHLPTEFRVDYSRISAARGENALAPVENETCTGCYTMLTAQTMNELFMSKPVFCKSCGALLYLTEDRRPR